MMAFISACRKPGAFRYRGKSEHDQYYLMTYRPKAGRAAAGDRGGKPVIVRPGDRIGMTGSTDAIYYCRLGGGIYDEPMLSSLLAVDDSLGRVRGRYLENAREASERNDTAASREWGGKFNRFYNGNPGVERKDMLRKAYEAANPHGSLYLLIDRIPKLSYTPAKEAHRFYKTLSEGLKTSYFGRMYADCMARMEQLAEGKPAPDFTLATTEDRTVAKADFKGRYLLLYHWGLCPGSIRIDGQVRDLYAAYKDRGLRMVGLTESVDTIRRVYEGLPDDESAAGMRSALAGMLEACPEQKKELERQKEKEVESLGRMVLDIENMKREFRKFYQLAESLTGMQNDLNQFRKVASDVRQMKTAMSQLQVSAKLNGNAVARILQQMQEQEPEPDSTEDSA